MYDGAGAVRNVQTITPDGQKRFVPGAQVSGLFSMLGKIDRTRPVLIAEGVATAQTMYEAHRVPTIIAYNAGNLAAVSKVIAEIRRTVGRYSPRTTTIIYLGRTPRSRTSERTRPRRRHGKLVVWCCCLGSMR